jgi:methyl-accepting chemotaxis protein
MKINLPITDVEIPLLDTMLLVSKTDLTGVISYASADFMQISGYLEAELLGQSHHILRHPDMPAEAFADMWNFLSADRPWTGLVKNRCKNGGFYWVIANVSPYYENDQKVGYLSVRTKPSAKQIAEFAAAYQQIAGKNPGKLKIVDGQIIKAARWPRFFHDFTIRCRVSLFAAVMLMLLMVTMALGLYSLKQNNLRFKTAFEQDLVAINQLAAIQERLLLNRIHLTSSLLNRTAEEFLVAANEIEHNQSESNKLLKLFRATLITGEEHRLAEAFFKQHSQYVTLVLDPAILALRANNSNLVSSLVVESLGQRFAPAAESLHVLINQEQEEAKQLYNESQAHYQLAILLSLGLCLCGVILIAWIRYYLCCALTTPLNEIVSCLQSLSQGRFTNEIQTKNHDEIGQLIDSLKSLQNQLGFDVLEIKRLSTQNYRIKLAMDSISTGVMVVDNDRHIVYLNQASVRFVTESLADINKIVPNFTVDSLMGASIDLFHKDAAHQAQLLAALTKTYKSHVVLGERSLVVMASPMISNQGQRLGTVAEWFDRSAEATLEKEVNRFVVAAVSGDFSQRVVIKGKSGFFRDLAEDLNQLQHVSECGILDVMHILGAISEGDLTQDSQNDYLGTMGALKSHANDTVEKLRLIINQIKAATRSINQEVNKITLDNKNVALRTSTQSTNLERAGMSVKQMSSAVQKNTANARLGNELAVAAKGIAGNGLKVVDQVVATMTEINAASSKIFDIISVIDSIAFQTNILALNAAVEAARAGQQGKGFAVVATEVRSLAHRSALAAGDIKNLIHNTVEKVEDGTLLVAKAGATMEEIASSINAVSAIMSQISMASMDQSFGIEQINLIMAHLEEVTQQNAGLVAEGEKTALALESQAKNLSLMIDGFKVSDSADDLLMDGEAMASEPSQALSVATVQTAQPKAPSQPANEEWEMF